MKFTTRLLAVALGLLSVSVFPITGIRTPTTSLQKEGNGPIPPWQAIRGLRPSQSGGQGLASAPNLVK
jgi:hypothetical protein